MPKRAAPPGIVPLVFAEHGGGNAVPARCCLCGGRIVQKDLCYGRLFTDPPGLSRPLHVGCKPQFEGSAQTLDI